MVSQTSSEAHVTLVLLYLPLLCQAPLQVIDPGLTANQLRLQLLPCLTDRATANQRASLAMYTLHGLLFKLKSITKFGKEFSEAGTCGHACCNAG